MIAHGRAIAPDDVPHGLENARGVKEAVFDLLLNKVRIEDRAQIGYVLSVLLELGVEELRTHGQTRRLRDRWLDDRNE